VQTMLAELTTMRLGGPAAEYEAAHTSQQLVALIREADFAGKPVLVMGGGSNLVVGDQGFDGLVVQVATSGMRFDADSMTVDAGVEWDTVVTTSLDAGLAGLAPDRCGFGSHRQSVFKHTDRYLVVEVTLQLTRSTRSHGIHYKALAEQLDIPLGATAPTAAVRDAVLAIRHERGMILDAKDHDTWSVGSFFLNPVFTSVPRKARNCPQYPDPAGTKLSAAWLIDHAGFPRGYGRDWGRGTVALSSKHALAITNRGNATTAEVMKFADHIREGVERRFDVRLAPECDLVNCKIG
jgi:UDP-N-acetylmuramate dehydrogenase